MGDELRDTSENNGNVLYWSLWTYCGLDWLESSPCDPGSIIIQPDDKLVYTIEEMSILKSSLSK